MTTRPMSPAWAAALTALVLTTATAGPALAEHRILLIGSSFTSGVDSRLESLIEQTLGEPAKVVSRTDRDQLFFHYQDFSVPGADLDLLAEGWDWVVLQEQSWGTSRNGFPGYLGNNYFDLDSMKDLVDLFGGGARTALFMTWEYERGADTSTVACDAGRTICPDWQWLRGDIACGDATDPYSGCTGYAPAGLWSWLDVAVAPVGQVFRNLGTVVDEQLVAVRRELFGADGKHASNKGKYVAALTIFLSLFGDRFVEPPADLWAPGSWDAGFVAEVQQVAWDAVHDESQVWNNPMPRRLESGVAVAANDAGQPLFQSPRYNEMVLPFNNLVMVGLRFEDVALPPLVEILDASVEARARMGGTPGLAMDVEAEVLLPVEGLPLDHYYGGDERLPSGTGVSWTAHPDPWSGWTSVADITAPVQALVDHGQWATGESLTVLMRGWIADWSYGDPGARDVWSFDGGWPAVLTVDYLY
jgi:hypothetical protein